MARGFISAASWSGQGLHSPARALLCFIISPLVNSSKHFGVTVRIACLGGGPGGLLVALLAKRGDPAREVTVYERNRAGDTFGFGVVFSDATLDGIDAADPVLRRALTAHGVHWDPIEVRLRGQRWRFGGNGMAAVARVRLLALLQQRAADAGVDLRFSAPARPDDLLAAGYDLVVAADGANSQLRA